ncbi:hypothetical protein EVJ58_g595 [Rhodofomes roseus]|uniref:Uncharacterized protein n=1 Tax=Rhodofomes roseus TaxID=34475 RepID=A0A4Y9Z3F4_9APHY|nr:hypothetical protein EVJ58_g595 [Rhodofomes roseus]
MAGSSSKHLKRKARAISPASDADNTDSLVEEIIAKHPKPDLKRPRFSAKTENRKASLKAARLETNAGLKSKGKGVAGRERSPGNKSAKATSSQKVWSKSSSVHFLLVLFNCQASAGSTMASGKFRVARIVLLPYGLTDTGKLRVTRVPAEDSLPVLREHKLVASATPEGSDLYIESGMSRADIDALLRGLFSRYFDWVASQGEDSEPTYLWRVVSKRMRSLEVAFPGDEPIPYQDLCVAVHNHKNTWVHREWCFVTTKPVPTEVWKLWGTPDEGGPTTSSSRGKARAGRGKWQSPAVDDDVDISSIVYSSDSDSGDLDGGMVAKGVGDSDHDSAIEAETQSQGDTDVSEWEPDDKQPPTRPKSAKLRRALDTINSSFSSIHLGEGPSNLSAAGTSASSTNANTAGSTATNPIAVFGSSSEDLRAASFNVEVEPPFTQSQSGSSRLTRSMTRPPTPVFVTRDDIADDPWAE